MAITRFDFTKAKKVIVIEELAKMKRAVDTVEAEAQDLCPKDKGHMAGAFYTDVKLEGNEIIGTIGNSAEYASHVEFGTKPHDIVPRNKPNLKFKVDGHWISTKLVHHPGFAGIPFLRGAMISKKREVKEILGVQ